VTNYMLFPDRVSAFPDKVSNATPWRPLAPPLLVISTNCRW